MKSWIANRDFSNPWPAGRSEMKGVNPQTRQSHPIRNRDELPALMPTLSPGKVIEDVRNQPYVAHVTFDTR